MIAAQNAVVAAESLGIGSCYIGDIMENVEEIRTLLALPEYVYPACMLIFGHPTAQQQNRTKPSRFDLSDIVCENAYQAKESSDIRRCLQAAPVFRAMMPGCRLSAIANMNLLFQEK